MCLDIVIADLWDGSPALSEEAVRMRVEWSSVDTLLVNIDAPFHNDPPPTTSSGPTEALWDYEVAELFLVGEKGDFLELELGPWGHHLVLYLSKPRTISKSKIPIEYTTRRDGLRWTGTATIDARLLPQKLSRYNAFAIHGGLEHRRYLAAFALPGTRPDFHQTPQFPLLPREFVLAQPEFGKCEAVSASKSHFE